MSLQVPHLYHEALGQLLSTNLHTRCWNQVASLCQQLACVEGKTEQCTELLQQLAATSSGLTDSLAIAVEQAACNSSQPEYILADLLPHLHSEVAAHRQELLLSPRSLSLSAAHDEPSPSLVENHAFVSRLCLPVRQAVKDKPPSLLSLFPTLQSLIKQEQTVRSGLQGSVPGMSCHMQPVHLRLADLISLFCPQFTSAFSHLISVQQETQRAVRCGERISAQDFDSEVGAILVVITNALALSEQHLFTSRCERIGS